MEASSSSKVTVEYHDPSGVFPLVSRDIASHLPLRNLNWQSTSRPLRQIRQLHVEFVPDSLTDASLRPPTQRVDSTGPTSIDLVRSGKEGRRDATKERRHQIPGLKTSPYLKIYVLRCDDKDQYKTTERARIREWVRENAQARDKKGENHNAFEWVILHVVVPGTIAASEPRWRESQSEPDTLKERKTSNVKFPGKSTKTVFDRLRADFNESSKGAQDRIAQIRLRKQDVPPDLLPTPAVAETLVETPQERENAWKDLMDKFKTSILGPFDARVRQYEADIAAQEARRAFPGWNFCTFFIHKEGLAKALESIGLVEDALVIYDELSLGLETVLRDLTSGKAEGTATSFAPYTDDIEARILSKNRAKAHGARDTNRVDADAAGLFAKDYREKIVRSDISVFDFVCYLFTRQKAIILRLANAKVARAELGGSTKDGGEDLVLTSEVCWRASSFIHNNARNLRQELANAPHKRSQERVEELVASWTYAVAEQALAETAAPVLDLAHSDEPAQKAILTNGTFSPNRKDFEFGLGANPYPQRTTSLSTQPSTRRPPPELQRPASMAVESTMSPPSSSGTESAPKGAGIPGLPELATYRAELVMMQRKMLEQLAAARGWYAGWSSLKQAQSKLEGVSLDADEKTNDVKAETSLLCPQLMSSLETQESFYDTYETLSDRAMRYYALATQTKSGELILGDLAILRRQEGDTAAAEDYIKHLLPSYETAEWSLMHAELLSLYASCLKELKRHEEYVNNALDLLAKLCGRELSREPRRTRLNDLPGDQSFEVPGLFSDVIADSDRLSDDVTRSAEQYFGDIKLEREVVHLQDKDGFSLQLHFKYPLDDDIELDAIEARLVSTDDASQDIWLSTSLTVLVRRGPNQVDLLSRTVTFGAYLVDRIVFRAKKLRFALELKENKAPTLDLNDIEVLQTPSAPLAAPKQPMILVYSSHRGFDASLSLVRDIQLNRLRFMQVNLDSGQNNVSSIEIKLKPFSAGLRLHTANATTVGIELTTQTGTKSGTLALKDLQFDRTATVKIPYTLEQSIPEISVRLEVRYTVGEQIFTFLVTASLRHELPFDVDVNDIFHLDTLYSNFTIHTTRTGPLRILETKLADSKAYAVEAPPMPPGQRMTVFEQSPARYLYRITRKKDTGVVNRKDVPLALEVRYLAFDELVAATIQEAFAARLQSSDFQALDRLLLPVVVYRSRKLLSNAEMENALVLEQVKLPSFEDFGWQEVLRDLPRAAQSGLSDWLQRWHSECSLYKIDHNGEAAKAISRQITIAVDVPTVDVVFNASLTLATPGLSSKTSSSIVTIGRPITAKLRLAHTDVWSTAEVVGDKKQTKNIICVCEVQADSDTWLIGGQSRVHFAPGEQQELAFDLLLIPLKLGRLALPLVDVQPEQDSADTVGKVSPAISCETHYESGGQVVQVVRDVRTTRIQIIEPENHDAPPSSARPSTASRAVTEPAVLG
ncbi:Trafficking protein particle complex subunit 10, TRAPPC10 [Teratosphaeria destructans]|uniref:Trafficking protein particle complex subunit 10, TRAPPC10 n=1 Tax=Teratosphaeria destructans TaxID=418781 RepID=A0A9W7SVZ9_9PEZI|nr:Trafficking protein particle complex subunit 10, TRAPPC10 [Teratosphaeria destructans]